MMSPPISDPRKGLSSLFGFASFKRSTEEKRKAFTEAEKIVSEIEKAPPLIANQDNTQKLQELEINYQHYKEPEDIAMQKRLDRAQRKYDKMSESSTKNVLAADLVQEIKSTHKQMKQEIENFNRMPAAEQNKEAQEAVYNQWRKIEQQAATLKYLTQIAKLKLSSSASVIQRSNSMGVKELGKILPDVSETFKDFGDARGKVLGKIGLDASKRDLKV